jgi:hypothetical protein
LSSGLVHRTVSLPKERSRTQQQIGWPTGANGNKTWRVLNYIWLALVLLVVATGGWNDQFKGVTKGALDSAKTAVTIGLGLIGIMALWLG